MIAFSSDTMREMQSNKNDAFSLWMATCTNCFDTSAWSSFARGSSAGPASPPTVSKSAYSPPSPSAAQLGSAAAASDPCDSARAGWPSVALGLAPAFIFESSSSTALHSSMPTEVPGSVLPPPPKGIRWRMHAMMRARPFFCKAWTTRWNGLKLSATLPNLLLMDCSHNSKVFAGKQNSFTKVSDETCSMASMRSISQSMATLAYVALSRKRCDSPRPVMNLFPMTNDCGKVGRLA